ncbi:hypothetical protein ACMAY5_07080 [Arenicellales bacterium nBUS_48]
MTHFVEFLELFLPLLASFLLTLIILKFLIDRNSVVFPHDTPNLRSLHTVPTPRGGGVICLSVAMLASLLVAVSAGFEWWMLGVGACIAGLGIVGFIDDHRTLSVRNKFLVQSILVGVMVGLILDDRSWKLFGEVFVFPDVFVFGPVLILMIWLVNLTNFIDGADGLLGVHGAIITITLGLWFYALDSRALGLIALVVFGTLLAFLRFNWSPARIFLGDVGSLALGGWFGAAMLIGITRWGLPVEAFVILYGYIVFDASFTLIRRLSAGKNVLVAHQDHLYQRLIVKGKSHQHVVLVTGGLQLALVVLASFNLMFEEVGVWLLLIATAILGLFTLYVGSVERRV